jgi:hypothetical protein
MTRANVEIVERDIAARDARDWKSLPEIWHPDIELDVVRGGTYRGIHQITDFFDALSNLHEDYRVEADEVIDAGERVVTVERVSGRGLKGSTVDGWIGETLFRVISFRRNLIWRVTEHTTRGEALKAAGLSE